MKKQEESIVLFEDEAALTLEPLSLTRPVWQLRCGIRTLEQKIRAFFPGVKVFSYARPHLAGIIDNSISNKRSDVRNRLWVNGSFLPESGFSRVAEIEPGYAWVADGRVVAFRGEPPAEWISGTHLPENGFHKVDAPQNIGRLVRYTWELVNAMNAENAAEARDLRPLGQIQGDVHPSAHLIGAGEIFMAAGCRVSPGVVIDATEGPVVFDEGVLVGANAVVEGPTYLGPGTQIKPLAHIRGSCFGEQCRVGGEVSVSIIQGFTNKQHGGFLGHSYLGSWCNLGSGTETSNLKNNYTNVKVQVGSDLVDTEGLFVGLAMGDHSKSAIGTVFNTGTVVGVACIIFGAGFPPRFIPSFHWGGSEKLTPYHLKPTLVAIRAVMARRNQKLSKGEVEALTWIHKNRMS